MQKTIYVLAFLVLIGPLAGQTSSPISDAAYPTLLARATAGERTFFVYRNADDPLNHGFPSGVFPAGADSLISTSPACIDDPASSSGCAKSTIQYDCSRGTVFQIAFRPFPPLGFAGLKFEEPNGNSSTTYGVGYDLSGATKITFDVRSPTGIKVQFGVAEHVTQFIPVPASQNWATLSFDLAADLGLQPADLNSAHTLFEIVTNADNAPQGGVLLLDNIEFTPIPNRQHIMPSLPVGTQVCGIVPVTSKQPDPYSVPPDQLLVNAAPVYEASLTLLSLLRRKQPMNPSGG